MYRLDVFEDNEWVGISWHKNIEHAEINMEVYTKSKNCDGRVIKDGKIVAEVKQ